VRRACREHPDRGGVDLVAGGIEAAPPAAQEVAETQRVEEERAVVGGRRDVHREHRVEGRDVLAGGERGERLVGRGARVNDRELESL
jgi:hypothetical protein